MDTNERARITGELLAQVALVHQAYVGNEVTVTVPNDATPTDIEAKEALGESLRLIGKLVFADADRVEALDAAPPAPLFALLGLLADEAWPLREAGVDPAQGRALSGLLMLIDIAADVALGICGGEPIGDPTRVTSAIQMLAGGTAGERHALRMVVDCLRESRGEYRQATSEEGRARVLEQVMAELPIVLHRDSTSEAKAVVREFLDVKPKGAGDGAFLPEVSKVLEAAFGFRAPPKTLDNAMQRRGKERLVSG